jgi:hypothetical protein
VDHPIAETEPFEPMNHYGVSKAAADLLGRSYALQGLWIINARPFNHSGPGQSPDFLLPTLVQQFAEIRAGKRDPEIQLGNLDSVRDLSDVRDVVRAYHQALLIGRPGEVYNVGSGRGVPVRDLFELVRGEAGVEVDLAVDPSRVRATDIPYLVANADPGRERGQGPPGAGLGAQDTAGAYRPRHAGGRRRLLGAGQRERAVPQRAALPIIVCFVAKLYEQVPSSSLELPLVLFGEDVLPIARYALPEKGSGLLSPASALRQFLEAGRAHAPPRGLLARVGPQKFQVVYQA